MYVYIFFKEILYADIASHQKHSTMFTCKAVQSFITFHEEEPPPPRLAPWEHTGDMVAVL